MSVFVIGSAGCSDGKPNASETPAVSKPAEEPKPAEKSESVATDPSAFVLAPLPEPNGEGGLYSIAQVMQLAHENKLFRQLYKDDFPPEVGERLMLLYSSLSKQSPPQGDSESWQKLSQSLVDATEKVINRQDGSIALFKRAVNCSSCHGRHRM